MFVLDVREKSVLASGRSIGFLGRVCRVGVLFMSIADVQTQNLQRSRTLG